MRVLVAVDGSRHSTWAVDLMLRLPFTKKPEIVVVHVVEEHPVIPVMERLMPSAASGKTASGLRGDAAKALLAAKQLVAKTAQRLSQQYDGVRTIVERGGITDRILARARQERADLIVLGSRGLSPLDSFLVSGASHTIATYAPCSVLIVKKKSPRLRKALVAVDWSQYSMDAVRFVASHFLLKGMISSVLYAWESPTLYFPKMAADDIRQHLSRIVRKAGFQAEPLLVFGHPARAIVKTVTTTKTDLVVMGSRGLTGIRRVLLGSVSWSVLQHCPSSVMIVRKRRTRS